MLSSELESCLEQAFRQVHSSHPKFVSVEHLLLAVLETPAVREALVSGGANLDRLGSDLRQHIEADNLRRAPDDEYKVQPQPGFQRVLRRAVFHVQNSGGTEVGVLNVLAAVFSGRHSRAVFLLTRERVTHLEMVKSLPRPEPLS